MPSKGAAHVTPRRPSLVTGLAVIEILATEPEGVGVSDIASRIHTDVGQAHRLLAALRQAGWVYQEHDQSIYRLTGRVLRVAGELLDNIDLVRAAHPAMIDLAATTGHTVGLMELRGDSLYLVAREQGSEPVQVVLRAGDRVPLTETAGGRAVLASLLHNGQPTDISEGLKHRLIQIHNVGFSVDNEEYRAGVRTVAAAIIGHDHLPIGAVGVMTPSAVISEDALLALGPTVSSCAVEISRYFGGYPSKLEFPSSGSDLNDTS